MRWSGAKSKYLTFLRDFLWKSLSNIKRTATGPDWVWKEHAEILTLILEFVSAHAYLAYVMEKIEY